MSSSGKNSSDTSDGAPTKPATTFPPEPPPVEKKSAEISSDEDNKGENYTPKAVKQTSTAPPMRKNSHKLLSTPFQIKQQKVAAKRAESSSEDSDNYSNGEEEEEEPPKPAASKVVAPVPSAQKRKRQDSSEDKEEELSIHERMASLLLPKTKVDVISEPSVMEGEPRSINDIPDEIMLKILSYFGIEDLCLIIAKVCERWNNLTKQMTLWKTLSYTCFRTSDISRVVQVLTVAPALHSLVIRGRHDVVRIVGTLIDGRVDIRKLILKYCNLGDDGTSLLTNIIVSYPDLEALSLEHCCPLTFTAYSLIPQLKQLSELNLSNRQRVPGEKLRLIADNCQYLKKLNVDGIPINDDDTLYIIEKLGKQLTTLVFDGSVLTDVAYLYLKNCPRLQELGISYCFKMTDRGLLEGIGSLQELTSLRLVNGDGLSKEALSAFFNRPSMASIVSLNLLSFNLDDEVLRGIAERCINLEELSFHRPDISAYLRNDMYNISDGVMRMVIRNCNKMRILNLKGLREIKVDGILSLVTAHLPHLKLLCLKNCGNVSADYVEKIMADVPELVCVIFDGKVFGRVGEELPDDFDRYLISDVYTILRQWALER